VLSHGSYPNFAYLAAASGKPG